MPRYDYRCTECGQRFEVIHGVHEDGPTACALCGAGPVTKAFAPPVFHFKGSGWAKKDWRPTPSSGTSKAGTTDSTTDSTSAPATTGDGEKPKPATDPVAPAATAAD